MKLREQKKAQLPMRVAQWQLCFLLFPWPNKQSLAE